MRTLVSLDLSEFFALKLEKPNLRMLIQNLTGLRELYLDYVYLSNEGTEWCEIISSSLSDLRKLSLRSCGISGPLDHSLSQLHSLSVLQLDENDLSTTIPNFFANFSSLTTLTLIDCSLKGRFPDMIFQIPTLETLLLADNKLLSGTIPQFHQIGSFRTIMLAYTNFSGSLPDSISNLTMLSYLSLPYCKFTGPIPQSLFRLPLLQQLYLSDNKFSGQINEVSTPLSSNMEMLDLSNNQLEGPIPKFFFKLERLTALSLSYNSFNGSVEVKKFQRLSNLTILDLSHNNLSLDADITNSSLPIFPDLYYLGLASCNLYKFPAFIEQSNLTYLDLSNNKITGEIPSWIWEVGNRQLRHLNLSFNLLTDLEQPYHFPIYLSILDLRSNQLRGELPFPSANNRLNGASPTSFCNATKLEVLDLSNNNLSGGIPPCIVKNNHYLEVLNLGKNNVSGDIPDTFPVGCRLITLDLRENNLGGNIPLSLANCKLLEVLNVGNNNINDSFPCMLSSNLRILKLRSNKFHGEMRCHESWPYLQIIDIASNNFSGYLDPRSFLSWGGMMRDNDAQQGLNYLEFVLAPPLNMYYEDEVRVAFKGLEMDLVKISTAFTVIDFSCNNFKGEIPDAIGDLNSLYVLNFSHNNLIGTIPKSVGNLTQLESLDLSMNHLIGEIPKELAELTFLEVLNLSYNKLVGMIPKGRQLQTFSTTSFDGNIGLCGLPLNRSCNNAEKSGTLPKFKNEQWYKKNEIHWDYVSAALGFVVGLGSYLWLLWGFQSLRQIFFYQIDNVLAKIFDPQDRRKRHGRRLIRNQVIRRG
ncbi:Leucine-rich repeat protein [Handroanthus impetiginosus]|uniref:Leucine-rich repeat protein n=1 Tax=Handroanthus impetiginosus TaxID=429701 RepID=A0A2G9G8X5_9LAMI|nr:Leucine-rich repeat protein [Handroanthus impetiginosus]